MQLNCITNKINKYSKDNHTTPNIWIFLLNAIQSEKKCLLNSERISYKILFSLLYRSVIESLFAIFFPQIVENLIKLNKKLFTNYGRRYG